MPIDKVVISKLLQGIADYTHRLEAMEFVPQELYEDIDIQDLVSHRLHVAVEMMIDISVHVAGGLNLPGRDTAADVFRLLAQHEILSNDLVDRIVKAPNQRNILVHEYLDVDYEVINQNYEGYIGDLKQFQREITEYLVKEGVLER